MTVVPKSRLVALSDLAPHPRNYRVHPPEQIEHLQASIREHGFYRNVVAAEDLTILAGHGIVEAAIGIEIEKAPTIILPIRPDSPAALKILAGDNEMARLATTNQDELSSILEELHAGDELAGLLGTGYDASDLGDRLRLAEALGLELDPAKEWKGMPAFDQGDKNSAYRCTVHFKSGADADAFFALIDRAKASSFWWPVADTHVGSSVNERYVEEAE